MKNFYDFIARHKKTKGKKMKKIFTLGLVLSVVATAANASWWNKLGFGRASEPKTLEEACNKDDLTAICPDMIMGSQTMLGCLSENINAVSEKCANFVKKSITENKDEIVKTVNETKEEIANAKAESKAAKAEQKAAAKEQKAELKKTAAELKAAAKQTGKDLEETGKSFKEIAK